MMTPRHSETGYIVAIDTRRGKRYLGRLVGFDELVPVFNKQCAARYNDHRIAASVKTKVAKRLKTTAWIEEAPMELSSKLTHDLSDNVRTLLLPALRDTPTVFHHYSVISAFITVDWSESFHHSALAAVIAVDTLVDRESATLAHAKVRLVDMIESIRAMDETEQRLLGAAGGIVAPGRDAIAFNRYLRELVARPGLRGFFDIDPGVADHYAVRPRNPIALPKGAQSLSEIDQIILVTIVTLYNNYLAREVFKRHWNPPAAEACALMNAAQHAPIDATTTAAVENWYGLMANYAGW